MEDDIKTYLPYLIEGRTRLRNIVLLWILLFVALLPFSQFIFQGLLQPALQYLPQTSLIATHPISPFLIPLKTTAWLALLLTLPCALYQLFQYIFPALQVSTQRYLKYLSYLSVGLFFTGVCFAFAIVTPMFYYMMTHFVPAHVTYMPDITHYLNFSLRFMLAFGLAFEIPVITLMLVVSGVASINTLKQKRRHIILLSFIAGMLLTPPDVISQILLAVPMWGLFELGLLLAKLQIK